MVIILENNQLQLQSSELDTKIIAINTINLNHIQVIIQANAHITLVQINTIADLRTDIIVETGAELNYILIQNNQENTNFILQHDLNQASKINSYLFNYCRQITKIDYTCNFTAMYAESNLHCLQKTIDADNYALNININHNNPNCTSNTTIRSIAADSSHAAAVGKIYVAKHATGTNANLQTKGILLSEHAEINAMPQLEIYNDEILCSHGAAIGSLDNEAIFYLKSRGLNHQQVQAILLDAFVYPTLPPTGLELPDVIRKLIIC